MFLTAQFLQKLNLYCDERRDILWNIAWARGKSQGRSLRDFLRAQTIFHRISRLESQYRHSQLQLQYCLSWRSILEEFILRIALTAGKYGKILPSRLSNTCELNVNIITFSNWECDLWSLCFDGGNRVMFFCIDFLEEHVEKFGKMKDGLVYNFLLHASNSEKPCFCSPIPTIHS